MIFRAAVSKRQCPLTQVPVSGPVTGEVFGSCSHMKQRSPADSLIDVGFRHGTGKQPDFSPRHRPKKLILAACFAPFSEVSKAVLVLPPLRFLCCRSGMDHESDVDYGPQLNALVWLLTSVSGLFLFTRLYLKNCQNRGLWWDDWILLASWVALTASAAIIAYVISLGYGMRFIPLANLPYFGLPVNILSTLMIITNLWGKTSFGMTLIRIPVRWMRTTVWYILVTLTLTLTASVLLVWVECSPLKLAGRCVPVDVSIRYNVFSCGKGVSRAQHWTR
jgi:hypothetical protein